MSQNSIAVHGPAIREFRKHVGLEAPEFAKAIGVTRPYVVKIELGHTTHVSVTVFTRMLSTLGIEDRRAIMASPFADEAAA